MRKGQVVAVVMIGVDPHKGSHTAVALSAGEVPLGQVRVRASAAQAERLLTWAQAWPERTWAVEGAGGLGHLLAQQLVAAGELVLDVQPKLAARVRLLAAGAVSKNDPNDARSVAVAALRSPSCLPVRPDDHAAVLKIWAKRHHDLSRARNQVACRLHAALCDLVPGGVSKEIYADQADQVLAAAEPRGAVQQARAELAAELVADLRRVDALLRETKKKLAAAVRASGTSMTEVFGVGPVISATVIGDVRYVSRFASRDRSPPITAPRRSRSPPATASSTGCRCEPTPPASRQPAPRAREGNRGTTLSPARPAHTPNTSSSARPLPDLPPPYDAQLTSRKGPPHAPEERTVRTT
jgi:transposase